MNVGRRLPYESGEERVVVGTLVAQPFEPARFHIAFVEDMVDAEPESVGVIGDAGAQSQLVVGVAESYAAEPAHGIGERRVVEIAAHDYIAGDTVYFCGGEVGLFVAGLSGVDELSPIDSMCWLTMVTSRSPICT